MNYVLSRKNESTDETKGVTKSLNKKFRVAIITVISLLSRGGGGGWGGPGGGPCF